MKLELRRIFISDLPENVEESELREKFSKYGRVSSTEIKERKEVGPKNHSLFFAFVSLEVDDSSLQRCFEDFASKKWKGQHIELQMAKESFLARLNKEREETKSVPVDKKVNLAIKHNGLPNNAAIDLCPTSSHETKNNDFKKPKLKRREIDDVVHAPDIIVQSSRHNLPQGKLKIESVGFEPIIKIEKAKPKSKDPKRAEADSKRIKSMIEMKKGYQQQKLLIKNALSKIDVKSVNKIIFDNEQELNESVSKIEKTNSKKAKSLFDDGDDDDDNGNENVVGYNFEVKEQFQGKKGQKLLQLQSRYKQDERFALSSKFLEDDEDDSEGDRPKNDEVKNENNEKEEQLMILEKVLGHKVSIKETETEDNKKKRKAMLRFDPAHPDHAKYEVKTEEVVRAAKKKKRKTAEEVEEDEVNKPTVSKKKFYEIAGDLKDVLNVKESFSLLDAFGKLPNKDDEVVIHRAEENEQKIRAKNRIKTGEKNPFKYDSTDDESDDNNNQKFENDDKLEDITSKDVAEDGKVNLGPGRLWTESFFFRNDDSRLQEGIDFIRKVQAEEVTEFSRVRRDLVEIVRAKVKNNQRRNRPFKKKLGGKNMLKMKRAMKR